MVLLSEPIFPEEMIKNIDNTSFDKNSLISIQFKMGTLFQVL